MLNDLMIPQTPREFALIDRIRMLESRQSRRNMSLTEFDDTPEPSLHLARGHPELIRVANLRADKIFGNWEVTAKAITTVPGEYYEMSQYLPRIDTAGWGTTSLLAEFHKDFIARLGRFLIDKYANIWEKYDPPS